MGCCVGRGAAGSGGIGFRARAGAAAVGAREAGAEILQEPETQFYGDRTYRARDPEGHIWTFGVTEKRMTPEEWDKASGLTTKKRLEPERHFEPAIGGLRILIADGA